MRYLDGGDLLERAEPFHRRPFRWHWTHDTGKLEPYPESISAEIEAAYVKQSEGKGHVVYTTKPLTRFVDDVPQEYKIDFANMKQVHPRTGFKRTIKRQAVDITSHVDVKWEVDLGGSAGWTAYDPIVSGKLEENFRAYASGKKGSTTVEVSVPGRPDDYIVELAGNPPVQINQKTQVERPVRRVVPIDPGAEITLWHESAANASAFLSSRNMDLVKREINAIVSRASGKASSDVSIDADDMYGGMICVKLTLGPDVTPIAALIVAKVQENVTKVCGGRRFDVASFAGTANDTRNNPRLLELLHPLDESESTDKPKDGNDAMLYVVRIILFDCRCSIYGGFIRDWVVAGRDANDIDVLLPDPGGDVECRRVLGTLRAKLPSTIYSVSDLRRKGAATAVEVYWTSNTDSGTFDVDLVAPSVAKDGTPPGVDCDVGNLMISAEQGLQLKAPDVAPTKLPVTTIINHIRTRKFVFFYNFESDTATRKRAIFRVRKYLQNGWTCLTPLPDDLISDGGELASFRDFLDPQPRFSRANILGS